LLNPLELLLKRQNLARTNELGGSLKPFPFNTYFLCATLQCNAPGGQSGLTLPVSGGPQEKRQEQPKKPTLWAVRSTGLLGRVCRIARPDPTPWVILGKVD
jgi:hypothetical protein